MTPAQLAELQAFTGLSNKGCHDLYAQFTSQLPPGRGGNLQHDDVENLASWLTLWAKGREAKFEPSRPAPEPFPWLTLGA